jgi:hypothetical protein
MKVPNKAECEGPDGNPRQYLSNNGWTACPPGDNPAKELQDQSDRDVDKQ